MWIDKLLGVLMGILVAVASIGVIAGVMLMVSLCLYLVFGVPMPGLGG